MDEVKELLSKVKNEQQITKVSGKTELTAEQKEDLLINASGKINVATLMLLQEAKIIPEVMTRAQLVFAARYCNYLGLDPGLGDIFFIARKTKDGGITVSMQIGISGFRKRAERTGEYDGRTTPVFISQADVDAARWDNWREVWTPTRKLAEQRDQLGNIVYDDSGKPAMVEAVDELFPYACKVGVYSKNSDRVTYAIAYWEHYAARKGNGDYTEMWTKFPTEMLAKCAEAAALRARFPGNFSGMYSKAELDKTFNNLDEEQRKVIEKMMSGQLEKDDVVINAEGDLVAE